MSENEENPEWENEELEDADADSPPDLDISELEENMDTSRIDAYTEGLHDVDDDSDDDAPADDEKDGEPVVEAPEEEGPSAEQDVPEIEADVPPVEVFAPVDIDLDLGLVSISVDASPETETAAVHVPEELDEEELKIREEEKQGRAIAQEMDMAFGRRRSEIINRAKHITESGSRRLNNRVDYAMEPIPKKVLDKAQEVPPIPPISPSEMDRIIDQAIKTHKKIIKKIFHKSRSLFA